MSTTSTSSRKRCRRLALMASTATVAFCATAVAFASANSAERQASSTATISQSERNLHRPKRPYNNNRRRPHNQQDYNQRQHQQLKGREEPPHEQEQRQRHLETKKNKKNKLKQANGGAFNANLQKYDPTSSKFEHAKPDGHMIDGSLLASTAGSSGTDDESWSPCPPNDANFAGNRASYDCSSYVYCAGGKARGQYHSCMGLVYDNARGVCDWPDDVACEYADAASSGGGGGGKNGTSASSEGNNGGNNNLGEKISAIAVNTANTAGSNGATANMGWQGGSDWGGRWINGVWVDDAQVLDSASASSAETAWLTTHVSSWEDSDIIPYPPHPILPSHYLGNTTTSEDLPQAYTSAEGWSTVSRGDKTVIGYYAAWQWYDHDERARPVNMQFTKVDRVNFAFFQTDEAGNIWGTDSWADPITLFGPHDWAIDVPQEAGYAPQFFDDNGFNDTAAGPEWNYVGSKYVDLGNGVYCHRTVPTGQRDCNGHISSEGLIGRAHDQGAIVYPSIGGWSLSEPFPVLAANDAARRNFAKNCVGLIREYNFDGIDIDWEFPGYEPHGGTDEDKENFILLLQDVRAALDAYTAVTYPNGDRHFGLTAALPCGPRIIDHQDVPALMQVLDELNLMTYDFHGTWDDLVGVNAPLYDQPDDKFPSPEYSVHGCVERYVQEGADRSKINIGLPFYGRSFGGATALYEEFDGPDGMKWWADAGQPQYYSLLEKLPDMISLRDDVTHTQYAYFAEGGIVSYDDNQAICDKVEYASEKELHGFIIWELSGDLTEDLITPLLDVVNVKLEQEDAMDCELFRQETRDENGDVYSAEAADHRWYAEWSSSTCKNDGKHPDWTAEDDLYDYKEECCAYAFEYKFDACVGPPTYEPTKKPTKEPTLSPIITEAPTDNPTHVFGGALVMDQIVMSQQTAGAPSTATTTNNGGPAPPETWCLGGCGNGEKCVSNQNHPQNIADDDCNPCQMGQTYWPCDVDGLCFCWNTNEARIPPAPGSGLAQLTDLGPCEDYFTEEMFKTLAPEASFPYTYDGLCTAINNYNDGHAEKIFMMGTEFDRKSELAAFLGHTLHESDELRASREYLVCADHQIVDGAVYCKPCDAGSFNWETRKCNGVGLAGGGLTYNGYCDRTIEPPIACECEDTLVSVSEDEPLVGYIPASKVFFGRGAIQLSWNYNYRAASEALTGDASTFCEDPDLVATKPEYAWGAGVFFWMETLKEETTCHKEALKDHDFGGSLNVINGGLECPAYEGGWHGEAVKMRLNRYCRASSLLGLDSILVFEGCKGLNNSFAECLEYGSCPDCEQYRDGFGEALVGASTPSDTVSTDESVATSSNSTESVNTPNSTKPSDTALDAAPNTTTTLQLSDTNVAESQVEDQTTTFSCPDDLQAVDGLPNCCVPEPAYHGDGACDPDSPYNTHDCEFDGGDCCRETCDLESTYACSAESGGYGPFGYYCVNPDLEEYINAELCNVTDKTRIGDGRCDSGVEMYNSKECNWDGGDCCEETCDERYAHFDCGDPAHPYDCQNPFDDSSEDIESTANETAANTTTTESTEALNVTISAAEDSYENATTTTEATEDSNVTTIENTTVAATETSNATTTTEATTTTASTEEETSTSAASLAESVGDAFAGSIGDAFAASDTEIATSNQEAELDDTTTTSAATTSTNAPLLPGLYVLTSSDDATIVRDHPDKNLLADDDYDSGVLQVDDDSGVFDSLIRFDLSGVDMNDDVAFATLRLYCTDGSDSGGIIGRTSSSNWDESTVTWRSAPPGVGAPIGKLDSVQTATWYEIDVTSLFASGQSMDAVSIRITSKTWNRAGYSSKRGANPPQLVLQMQTEEMTAQDATVTQDSITQSTTFTGQQDQTSYDYGTTGTGLFFPVWSTDGAHACIDGTSPPTWAIGAYLKESKTDCCKSFFSLQVDECLES